MAFFCVYQRYIYNSDSVIKIDKAGKDGQGVDVIDPARVTKEAIQSAVSIAGTSITMDALVVRSRA